MTRLDLPPRGVPLLLLVTLVTDLVKLLGRETADAIRYALQVGGLTKLGAIKVVRNELRERGMLPSLLVAKHAIDGAPTVTVPGYVLLDRMELTPLHGVRLHGTLSVDYFDSGSVALGGHEVQSLMQGKAVKAWPNTVIRLQALKAMLQQARTQEEVDAIAAIGQMRGWPQWSPDTIGR
jgi:hypothetical protein